MLPQKTRGRVAVIGSGPAGLTVAGDLARQGFNVTIFEGQAEPGGVLMYGIPEYRLPKSVVRDEVAKIAALGVQFITNCMVGENNVTIDSLFRAGYDAIFMGTGTSVPQNMDSTPGSKLHGVSQSTYFLHNVNAYNEGALTRDMVRCAMARRWVSLVAETWPWMLPVLLSDWVPTLPCCIVRPRKRCLPSGANMKML